MPYYEYECDNCGDIKEKFYPCIPRENPTHMRMVCRCVNSMMSHKKVLSASTFHLKGVGWAKDGYDGSYQDGSKIVSVTEG